MSLVIGVMSTYNPDASVVSRANQHLEQLDKLIVVDDGSKDSEILNQLNDQRITLIRLATNSGIAKALNVGTELAVQDGAQWVLHIDQDSALTPNYVDKCIHTFRSASHTTRLGIVLSDYVNDAPAIPPRYSPEGFGLVDEGIKSGMMISKECLDEVGLLDERLFVDCVDTEYCLRARDLKWNIAIAPQTKIIHSLGAQVPFAPFGKTKIREGIPILFQYHPPFRQYYIVRNNIDLCIRHMFSKPRWVLSVIRREFVPIAKNIFGGPSTFNSFVATLCGCFDGLLRRRGKIHSSLNKFITN